MKATILLTLAGCALASFASAATISHRWSFDTDTTDSVGGNTGVLVGGATVGSGALQLTGLGVNRDANHMGFTSPVDIGGNFGTSGVTIETWYTDSGTGTWGKLFQFGNNVAGQELAYTHSRGNGEMSGVDRNGAQLLGEQVSQNTPHHLVISVSSDGSLNTWLDGAQKLTNVATNDLSNINTTFEGIGATSWNDPGMTGTVDEFRIYSGELTAGEVTTSLAAGPNTIVPEPSGLALALFGGLLAIRRRRA
jgi:MYXO-CTERM domain-containing protein